jgi:5-methyltetrahydrofolate--homocysteine methyltransferase
VVAISNDETGISEDPDVRFAVAKRIVERAADHGIPRSDIVVDPLVMPIGAINQGGVQVMRLVRRLRDELKVNTTCGASNISFGLPNRDGINSAFLTMAIASGLTSAITNPLHVETIRACLGADVMMGHDPHCERWIRRFREEPPPGTEGEPGRGRRERGRRPRA